MVLYWGGDVCLVFVEEFVYGVCVFVGLSLFECDVVCEFCFYVDGEVGDIFIDGEFEQFLFVQFVFDGCCF